MSTAALIAHQARYDLRTFARDPRARWASAALPLLLLLMFGYIFRHQSFSYPGYSVPGDSYYVAHLIVLGMVASALSNLVVSVVTKRETGALKRRRATPVRSSVLISGDMITSEVSAVSLAVVLVVLGWALFGVHLDGTGLGAAILTVVVGTVALCGVGFAVATFVTSMDSAVPVVMLVMFALNALSGVFFPDSLFPAWLRDVAQALPVRPLATAMQAAFNPATNGGRQVAWLDLLIVLAWGVAGTLVALRRFSWVPSRG